jgi:hypothetical protein
MVFVYKSRKIDCVKINKNFSYYQKKKGRFIMKAKYYIGVLSVLLLTFSTVKGQSADSRDYRNDDAKLVVNNYYDNYDYYFASRINRFHRSYAAFDYYSPLFTDPYWYDYQPWYWGLNIYGGNGLGFNFGYGDYYGYDPYFGVNYSWGYDPFYYNSWFTPFIFNFNFGNRWRNNYWGWNGHNHYYGYNDYRYNHYSGNNHHGYNLNRYSYAESGSRRNPGSNSGSTYNNNVYRRDNSSGNYSRNEVSKSRPVVRNNNGLHAGETRRVSTPAVNREQPNNARTFGNKGNISNNRFYASNNVRVQNSRNINTGVNNNRSNNYISQGENNNRTVHSNGGISSHSYRSMSSPQVHSSSRSMTSGSGIRSSSSHGSSRSSGSRSGSSHGKSSRRR